MHGIKHIEFKELTLEDLFEAEDQSEIEVEIERERGGLRTVLVF